MQVHAREGLPCARKSGVGQIKEAKGCGSAVPSGPGSLRPLGVRGPDNSRLAAPVKAAI